MVNHQTIEFLHKSHFLKKKIRSPLLLFTYWTVPGKGSRIYGIAGIYVHSFTQWYWAHNMSSFDGESIFKEFQRISGCTTFNTINSVH
jgi:hypothetical protein